MLVVAVVGFHHKHGNIVEWIFPEDASTAAVLDDAFRDSLAFAALPDGAHHASEVDENDWSYFAMPRPEGDRGVVLDSGGGGVARQWRGLPGSA